jgi:CarD family transcriptional regulator
MKALEAAIESRRPGADDSVAPESPEKRPAPKSKPRSPSSRRGVENGPSKSAEIAPTTPKANPEPMEAEKTPVEVQELSPPILEAAVATPIAEDAAPVETPAPVAAPVEDDEPEEAPVRVRADSGRGSHMGHGRPQMSGPAPRIPSKAENFVEGDYVVYPTHGVGKVEKINVEDIAGHRLELIHITFEENRMTLRVPVAKARSAGLRKLATRQMFDEALAVLKGRARIKRTMWSRRAQEYEAKINSGDPLAIAEVVRDLHRNAGQPDQSFSERQIYEAAMDRLGAELAALDRTDKATAATKLAEFLKSI